MYKSNLSQVNTTHVQKIKYATARNCIATECLVFLSLNQQNNKAQGLSDIFVLVPCVESSAFIMFLHSLIQVFHLEPKNLVFSRVVLYVLHHRVFSA